jgi:hypothetical protein
LLTECTYAFSRGELSGTDILFSDGSKLAFIRVILFKFRTPKSAVAAKALTTWPIVVHKRWDRSRDGRTTTAYAVRIDREPRDSERSVPLLPEAGYTKFQGGEFRVLVLKLVPFPLAGTGNFGARNLNRITRINANFDQRKRGNLKWMIWIGKVYNGPNGKLRDRIGLVWLDWFSQLIGVH